MRRLVFLLPLALLAFGSAGAAGPANTPGAQASAQAIMIVLPSGTAAAGPVGTTTVQSPPNAAPSVAGAFAYPAGGAIVSAASTTATATTSVSTNAAARAESDVTSLSLFGGELTATALTARASGGTGYSGAGGNANGSSVTGLVFEGQPVNATHLQLGTWGELTVDEQGVDRTAPAGVKGYRGFVTELDVTLTADHGGLPAGSEIKVGYAEVAVQTAPPAASTVPSTTTGTTPTPPPSSGDSRADVPKGLGGLPKAGKGNGLLHVHPALGAGPYVFPVYGPSSYVNTLNGKHAAVAYRSGDDIFGALGQPIIAVTNGVVFDVGWNKTDGNRLWLLDGQGNQFSYAHLSAFSTAATNGAHVKAGQVIGFMGNTGGAAATPYHLTFEVHPVSLLYLGSKGAVDPTFYLNEWSHQTSLPYAVGVGWSPAIPGHAGGPQPGAVLLGMSDISSANGLDPASLERALTPVKASTLMQALLPATQAPRAGLTTG